MTLTVLIQFGAPTLAALAGGLFGWWLRGRPFRQQRRKQLDPPQKKVAAHVLQSLQSAADTVRSCVEQHMDCIRAIQAELADKPSTEPIVITRLAESIRESNGLVQHQFNDIRQAINDQRKEIRDSLANADGLLFTFAALDRQKQAYNQVLSSLETLAAELANEVKGHGQRLQKISGELETGTDASAAGIASAVTQILDATDGVQTRLANTEERITQTAENVQMQAILTHTDLLTSLPNRRALDAELERLSAPGSRGLATVILVDLDAFGQVNNEYGHQGGDVVLRDAARTVKKLVRGRDMVARYRSDEFAIVVNQTTLHDALPLAERIRKALCDAQFSHGARQLHVTASVGIAQMRRDDFWGDVTRLAEQAVAAAQQVGGNVCYRYDSNGCHPVSMAFQAKQQRAGEETLSLASLWRNSSNVEGQDRLKAAPRQIRS